MTEPGVVLKGMVGQASPGGSGVNFPPTQIASSATMNPMNTRAPTTGQAPGVGGARVAQKGWATHRYTNTRYTVTYTCHGPMTHIAHNLSQLLTRLTTLCVPV